jgi:hypothetical protein
MKMRNSRAVIGALLALGGVVPAAQAASVSVPGTNVTYAYDTDQFAGLGATVSVVGDSLRILFNDFKATDTAATVGPTDRNVTLTFSVLTNSPAAILTGLSLAENGDYRLNDFTVGNLQGAAVGGEFRIYDNNNIANADTQGFSSGDLLTLTPGFGATTNPWSAGAVSAGVASWATNSVSIQVQNLLLALALDNDISFVEKKFVAITPNVRTSNPVPVPPSVWLLGTALLALLGIRRRV